MNEDKAKELAMKFLKECQTEELGTIEVMGTLLLTAACLQRARKGSREHLDAFTSQVFDIAYGPQPKITVLKGGKA